VGKNPLLEPGATPGKPRNISSLKREKRKNPFPRGGISEYLAEGGKGSCGVFAWGGGAITVAM